MTNMAAASKSLHFDNEYRKLDPDLRLTLDKQGFNTLLLWGSFFLHPPGTEESNREHRELAEELGAKEERAGTWAAQTARLYACAKDQARNAHQRLARVEGVALTADLHHYEAEGERARVKRDLRVIEAHGLTSLPTEWRGKRYKRTEGATEQARATAEHKERARRGKELAALLLEADLPFAYAPGVATAEEGALLRCCRGLSAKTLD